MNLNQILTANVYSYTSTDMIKQKSLDVELDTPDLLILIY